jgi:hypothetical protein
MVITSYIRPRTCERDRRAQRFVHLQKMNQDTNGLTIYALKPASNCRNALPVQYFEEAEVRPLYHDQIWMLKVWS